MSFQINLKKYREQAGLSQYQLADLLGVRQSTVGMWENGKNKPRVKMLEKISLVLGITSNHLIYDFDETDNGSNISKVFKIPVLGTVQAGIPMEAIENIIDYEEISEEMARSGEYFGLRVKGSSMEPKFSEGDVVIVRKQPNAENGEIAIILVNGSEATIKKIKKDSNGIMLIPSNPNYEVQFYDKKDIEEKPVQIIGKVVELRAKF